MPRGKILLINILTLVFAVFSCRYANAQVDSLLRVGDTYHKTYRFSDAIDAYDMALNIAEDTTAVVDSALISVISEKILLSENGSNMSKFVRSPKVVGRKRLSLNDFHLYYPVKNKGWRPLPNVLDNDDSDSLVHAVYAPDWNNVHYYSAKDENGVRSIFMTQLQDTLWSVPCRVEELSTATSNEIFPMLSPDKKTLYFASDGLYGLGGYDIYRSEWNEDEGKWSMPQNMGMPFSSPEDDFLYVDSEDEKYSLFASTRGCPKDSVWLYAIEYERFPLHSPVENPEDLHKLSLMNPIEWNAAGKQPSQTGELKGLYLEQMREVVSLKDSISLVSKELDKLRMDLAFSHDADERFDISAKIIELEKRIPVFQKNLEIARAELHKTESEFLKKGIFIEQPDSRDPIEEEHSVYEFVKLSVGPSLELDIAVPEVKFDYSFRIIDESLYAEDQSLPAGIVYQIQLLGGSHKVELSKFKGLTPLYEHRSPSGMYIYRVGRFQTYNEALENVPTVRKLGFSSAYLCAFENGKEISVARARTLQEQLKGGFSLCEIVIMPDSGELDPFVVEVIINSAIGKDIKRSESEDGTQIFSVGPFDNEAEAEGIISAIKDKVQGLVVCKSLVD